MIPFKKFYISEKKENYGRYKYKLMNRLRENSDENIRIIINNMSGRASILSFPFDYNFESNILQNYEGPSELDVYSAERLKPQSKEQDVERSRVNKARKFLRNHPGSRVFFPAEYIKYDNYDMFSKNKHQGELVKVASKDVDVENVLNGKFGFVDVNKMGYRCGVIAYCGYVAADMSMVKLPVCDIIDLDYITGPSFQMMMQIRKAYKYLKQGGLLMVGINLRGFRGGEAKKDRDMFKMYTPKTYRTIGDKNYDVPEQQQREYGITNDDSYEKYNNITFNVLMMIKNDLKVPLTPIYVNHYRGGTDNKGHAMLRLGFTK
jgi:hypothetical protein